MATRRRKSFLELLTGGGSKTKDEEEREKTNLQPSLAPEEEQEIKMMEDEQWLADSEEGQLTLDVYQTDKEIVIKSTIAGVKPEDLDIGINNGMVTIRGERKKEEEVAEDNYYYQELYWGSFSRSVILPVEVEADKAEAELKNGILTIRLPKKETASAKKIKVKAI